MNDPAAPASSPVSSPAAPVPGAAPAGGVAAAHAVTMGRWFAVCAVVLTALSVAALTLAWNTQQRLKATEQELARRQQESGGEATEARMLAREAQSTARDAAAKMALLEARVAENTMQRSQFEDLLQSLSRSRDENVLADVDAAIRVAVQQSAITGSVEPLATALKQTEERLARMQQPRLERVRRAAAQDLEAVKAAGTLDLPTLTIRLDESVRVVDDLPLVANLERRLGRRERETAAPPPVAGTAARAASAADAPASSAWPAWIDANLRAFGEQVWNEVRSLVRVTRIDVPEAALLAPEQAFFVRENLKLRLLNARLALLSRQFDIAQTDLREATTMLERYFDRGSRRVNGTIETLRQVGAQARALTIPRPDATLAAVAAAAAGR